MSVLADNVRAYGEPADVIALCDAHERLEAAIRGDQGEPRAILTVNVLRWPEEERLAFARHLLGSEWKSPEHERLETDLEMMGDYVDYLQSDLATLEEKAARPLSLDEWILVTRRMLDEVYPESIFTGVSGDPGPRAIVVIREAWHAVDRILGEVRG